MSTILIRDLQACHENRALYGPFDPAYRDSRFAESVERVGVLVPILVNHNNKILKGHRRVAAASAAGHSKVPCIWVDDRDWDSSHRWGLKQQRRLSVYSVCLLNRHLIQTYIALDAADNAPTGEEWYKLELEIGYSKDILTQGVRVLDVIDFLRAEDTRESTARACRIEQTFREQGLAPTLRVLDLDDFDFKNVEPDPGDWDDEETAGVGVPDVRPPACCPRPPAWVETVYRSLASIEKVASGHIDRTKLRSALDVIELLVEEGN